MRTEHEIEGYKVYIVEDVTVGQPQQSTIDYIRTQMCQGNYHGELIEGRWYTSDNRGLYEQLAKQG